MDMRKNSSILKFVLKIILAILIFLFLFLAFLAIKDRDWETFLWAGKILAGCSLVIIAICYIAYWLVTKYFGGTYSWCYEMDEDGIRYWQPEEQAEKARNIAKTSAAVGAVTGNLIFNDLFRLYQIASHKFEERYLIYLTDNQVEAYAYGNGTKKKRAFPLEVILHGWFMDKEILITSDDINKYSPLIKFR